ncbi:hypothetical protein [Zobellia galactanivorans]|uniref:hypothetical protein n=1 Tax=Zobellia galactanivorans (strain DSM 12802 / CCUG 47099 / CIP 106680 / NCIMB 13871 / Dsij) TaxID=63186 RepID=UPI001C066BB2|nr:hypothetical protein [Zobellia galactanivorans]MBU3026971.1 hypothetical protein [Zobellia galactanivorans]
MRGTFLHVFIACEGQTDPPGFKIFDGEDHIQVQVFEAEGVNFNYAMQKLLKQRVKKLRKQFFFEINSYI